MAGVTHRSAPDGRLHFDYNHSILLIGGIGPCIASMYDCSCFIVCTDAVRYCFGLGCCVRYIVVGGWVWTEW